MAGHAEEPGVIGIQHPLENHLILDLVFGYYQPLSTFEDWKNFRAVCKTWHFQSLAKWRAFAVLNLKLGPTNHHNQPEGPGVSMSEFLTLVEEDTNSFSQFTQMPFQKYKLQNLVLDLFAVKKNSLFWTSVGPNIKHLSLREVNIKTATNTLKEVMEFLVNQFPNLESFALSSVYIEGRRINQPPKKIIVVHPNIRTLSISNCLAFGFANFPNLKEVFLNSCGSNDIAKLAEVEAHHPEDYTTNSSIERLKLENFSTDIGISSNRGAVTIQILSLRFTALKHLSVDRDRECSLDMLVLTQFISNHAETLETIEVFGSLKQPTNDAINCLIATNMPSLTELRTWGNVFFDLSFIEHTPNLKILHLDLFGFEKQEKIKKDLNASLEDKPLLLMKHDPVQFTRLPFGVVQTTGKNLHYLQINYELTRKSFQGLAKWLLNLKTIKTILNKETFPVVCENWPELEHLECMFGSSILNESITGITEGSSDGQKSKALIDMDSLTTFKLHTECNKSLLSDEVTTGFLRMPKLTNLTICVSPEFSQDAEILLRRGIQNVQLYRNYSSNPLHINWQCCRDKEYKNFIFRPQEHSSKKNLSDVL